MRLLELPDALRDAGLEPVVIAGFESRGVEYPRRPRGALRHWTAGGPGLFPSQRILTFGRPDLTGPLCTVGQDRYSVYNAGKLDRAWCIASGKANHAGAGHWPKGSTIDSNYELSGLEVEWAGPGEQFSDARREVSERIIAVLIDLSDGQDPGHAAEHREYAEPAGRKIDTNLDGNYLRRRIQQINAGYTPPTTPTNDPRSLLAWA